MLTFLSSISWIGWALIVLAGVTIWQLPAIIKQWRPPQNEQKMQPGQEPPTSGSG